MIDKSIIARMPPRPAKLNMESQIFWFDTLFSDWIHTFFCVYIYMLYILYLFIYIYIYYVNLSGVNLRVMGSHVISGLISKFSVVYSLCMVDFQYILAF